MDPQGGADSSLHSRQLDMSYHGYTASLLHGVSDT